MRKDLNSVYQKESSNELIFGKINSLKGKVKTYNELTKIINKKFSTEFQMAQIKYQTKKLKKKQMEIPTKTHINL